MRRESKRKNIETNTKILGIIVLIIILIWAVPFIHNELLTVLHGKEFYNRYIDTGFFDENSEQESCKVLSYSKTVKGILCNTGKEQGLILYFTKNENNIWEMSSWDCIWSKSGTADGFQWPYFWQNGFSNDTYYTGKAG